MKKILFALTGLIAALLLSCSSMPNGSRGTSSHPGSPMTVLFSQDRQLEMEPCGCSMNPLGGLEREWNYLESMGSDRRLQTLHLVSGRSFIPAEGFEKANLKNYRIKAKAMAEAFKTFGTKALSIDLEDTRLGVDFLKELGAPLISTNLVSAKTKQPIFDRYQKLTMAGREVLILGVSETGRLDGVEADDPFRAIETVLSEVTPMPETIFILSGLDRNGRDKLLEKFPKVTAVLGIKGSHGGMLNQVQPTLLTVQSDAKGRELARIDFYFQPGYTGFYNEAIHKSHVATRERWQVKLKSGEKIPAWERQSLREFIARSEKITAIPRETSTPYEYQSIRLNADWGKKLPNPMTDLIDRAKEAIREIALSEE